jgi:hypothetical protein
LRHSALEQALHIRRRIVRNGVEVFDQLLPDDKSRVLRALALVLIRLHERSAEQFAIHLCRDPDVEAAPNRSLHR